MKKSVLTLALAGILTVGGTVLAFADDTTPQLGFRNNGTTGIQSLIDGGLTFEEAKNQMLETKYERVDAAVENGTITADRAEEIKTEMQANLEDCTTPGEMQGTHDGYGLNAGLGGRGNGNCDGTGLGQGSGSGKGFGQGQGAGKGNGMGMKNGACLVTE